MSVPQNLYTGNGATVLFSFTFPYLEDTDVKASIDGVDTTEYTLDNATTVRFNTAPANGAKVRIYRRTENEQMIATFYPGSAIRSQDLNDDFSQVLYVAQESTLTADNAQLDVDAAIQAANQAIQTAEAAETAADLATATANSASSDASTAVNTANSAVTTAGSAVSTANSAVSIAQDADSKADAAIAAVVSSVNYIAIANVGSIPGSPTNNTYIEVLDSTGLESFTPLAGMPVGFVGDSGLRVRMRYTSSGSTWNWIDYAAKDPEGRYIRQTSISTSSSSSSTTTVASSSAVKAAKDAADAAQVTASAALPKAGGTMTGEITFVGSQTFPAASTSSPGVVQLSTSTSSTSTTQAATPSAVKSVQDFVQVVSTTANAAMPKAGGTFTGDVDFGTTTATKLPVGTTAQRPTGATGQVRFNTTINQYEGYNGTAWSPIGGGAKVSATAPSPATDGMQWYDLNDGRTYVYVNDEDSSQWVDANPPVAGVNTYTGFKNVIINGLVNTPAEINQRGVTIAAAAVGSYGPDRWKKTGASTMTQIIEEGCFEPGAGYTLSGTGIATQQLTAPASGHWTLPDVPITASKIQLERGNVATPFEWRPKQQELALCQRYFHVLRGDGSTRSIGTASASSSDGIRVPLTFPAPMRVAPTFTATTGAITCLFGGTVISGNINGFPGTYAYGGHVLMNNLSGGTVSPRESALAQVTASGVLSFDAEL